MVVAAAVIYSRARLMPMKDWRVLPVGLDNLRKTGTADGP
jgi:hypothetical protein